MEAIVIFITAVFSVITILIAELYDRKKRKLLRDTILKLPD